MPIPHARMLRRVGQEDYTSLVALLKACAQKRDLCKGIKLHADIAKSGVLDKSPHLSSMLITMYAKCGMLVKAKQVLEELRVRDIVSWNALISGYTQQGQGYEALACLDRMRNEGLSPDAVTFTCILKACGNVRAIEKGKEIHDEILGRGLLETDIVLGTALVDMYSKCGLFGRAREVLEELPIRTTVSWNSLITGYTQSRQCDEAFNCFERMQHEGLSPDMVTMTCILKCCASIRAVDKGKQIHETIMSKGLLEKDIILGNALVDMYAKCDMLAKAQEVLRELRVRDAVSWNTLIAGYTQQGKPQEALDCFEQMESENFSPNAVTFICILKACGSLGALDEGIQIHEKVVRWGLLEIDIHLGVALIDMYVKCRDLLRAQQTFEELPIRTVVSWNALIAGFIQEQRGQEALKCFEQMQMEGLCPDTITLICILKACGSTRAIDKGKQIHEQIVNRGLLEKDTVLGTALLDMYVKCCALAKAQNMLEELPVRNTVSWCALIAGYTHQGQPYEALNCFETMESEGLSPDVATFVCILKACGSIGNLDKGKCIHNKIVRHLMEKDIMIGTALVDMYTKCAMLSKAQEVLDELTSRNVICWNALISGYSDQGQCYEALKCLEKMESDGVSPDAVTFICILKACGITGMLDKGKKVHDEIVSRGFLEKHIILGNALVDMYAKCGSLGKAQQVLEMLPVVDIASWNAVIAGYAQQGLDHRALNCFERMQSEGISPDAVTFTSILKLCARIKAVNKGKQVHKVIASRFMLKKDTVLGNALVDMYAKCGMLIQAQEVLEEIPVRDIVSWCGLLAGYVEQGQGQQALACFEKMRSECLSPDPVTYTCILKACAIVGAIDKGKQIHDEILHVGFLEKDIVLGNALLDMYAKCNALLKAQEVLEELPIRNLISWNTLIAGYSQQGKGPEALKCFERMESEGLSPDAITFHCVLSACSHMGMLDEMQMLYGNMTRKYRINPDLAHYGCMMMAFGNAGHLDKAISVIKAMPSDYPAVWLALLGSCRKGGNVNLGQLAFDQALQLDVVQLMSF